MKYLILSLVMLSGTANAKVALIREKSDNLEVLSNLQAQQKGYPLCKKGSNGSLNTPCYFKDTNLANGDQSGVVN